MRMNLIPTWTLAIVLSMGLGTARASTLFAGDNAAPDRTDNQLQLRQFHVDHVNQETPDGTVRQNMTCWQVLHGSWNGQTLDGLAMVMVQQRGDSDPAAMNRCIYISETATVAQRNALVSAVAA